MTYSEVKLWQELRNFGMMQYDFDRQRIIGNYIVDFYCKDLLLAIEVDGITHQFEEVIKKDATRQRVLEEKGVRFLRFNALDVIYDIENVRRAIEHWIIEYEEKNGIPSRVVAKRHKR